MGFEPSYKEAKPNLSEMLSSADCALLIGDPALVINEETYRKFDLAEVWREFTGCGFVFAMWMARGEKSDIARKINFAAARDEGLAHLDEIIANYADEIALSANELRQYLTENISFSIDENMHQGLQLFYQLAHKNKLIEKLKALKFL